MGLFFSKRKTLRTKRSVSSEYLQKAGCRACPKKNGTTLSPHGSDNPIVYILGESPTAGDAKRGEFFSGQSGKLLKSSIPRTLISDTRYNCISRSHIDAEVDKKTALLCCKNSIVTDIEETQPELVVGLGHAVLPWILPKQHNLDAWSGKRIPVKIGKHVCWFMATYDPVFLIANRSQPKWSKVPLPSRFEEQFTMEMKRLFKEFRNAGKAVVHSGNTDGIQTVLGTSQDDVKKIRSILKGFQGSVGLDIETTGLSPYTMRGEKQRVLSIAISSGSKTVAFPVDHPSTSSQYRAAVKRMLARSLKQLGTKVAHNLLFELKWLALHCSEDILELEWDDTMLLSYLDDARKGTQSLEYNVQQHLGFSLKSMSSVDTKDCISTDLQELLIYNGLDAKYTKILYDTTLPKLEESCKWMHKQRLDMASAVTKISLRGMPISRSWYEKHIAEYRTKTDNLLDSVMKTSVVSRYNTRTRSIFNPQSDKNIISLADHELGITLRSADESSLKKEKIDLFGTILEHRKGMKILGTYLEGWFQFADDDDLIHPDYNTMRTATSRLSSEKPNGQNCIAKGTLISTIQGQVPIEDIKKGDLVWSFDDTLSPVLREVKDSWCTIKNAEVVRVSWKSMNNNNTASGFVECTPDHRIRNIDGSYTQAQDLSEGDRMLYLHTAIDKRTGRKWLSYKGNYRFQYSVVADELGPVPKVTSVEKRKEQVDVYDLSIEGTQNFVANEICVHNSPKRKNKWCRNGIQAPKGYVLASIDYGQIEARTIGILSKDPAYVGAMWSESDIHMDWAFKTAEAYPEVLCGKKTTDPGAMKAWRTTIKNAWTFPLFFGAGINTISRETGIPKDILDPIIKEFWHVFAASKKWQEGMHSLYKRKGYVETAMGFRRYGPLSHSEVLNTPIQGTASTLVNYGINVLLKEGFPVIGTIHDSLEFCIKESEAEDMLTAAAEVMLCAPLREFDFICAPLVAEVEIGERWGELEVWKEFSSKDFGHTKGKRFK